VTWIRGEVSMNELEKLAQAIEALLTSLVAPVLLHAVPNLEYNTS
jgi:hypothetical protein